MITELKNARHEAAHAVAAWRTGSIIKNVTVIGPTNENGTPFYCESIYPKSHGLGIRDIIAALKADFAPACIEPDAETLTIASLNDVFQFMRFITWDGPEPAAIAADAAELMKSHGDRWEDAAREFFKIYRPMASPAVNDEPGRDAVDRLSRLLMTRGRLSGFEAVSYLERIWTGDTPPAALRAADHPTGLRADTTPADALQSAKRLCRMAFEILKEHGETCEPAAAVVLNAIFQLEGM